MNFFKEYENYLNQYEYNKIISKNNNYYIHNQLVENNRSLHNDVVYYNNNCIVNIKSRSNQLIVGILYLKGTKYGFNNRQIPYYKFTPISNKYPNFIVPCKNNYKNNIYCVIKFNKWETNNKHPIGQLEYQIGLIGDIKNEYQMLLYKHNIFPIKNKITYYNNLEIKTTPDYTVFSVDPNGCKDIDDALHITIHNEYIEIGIHIASVSEFLKDFNFNSFSSIYFPKSQINMINDEFSYNHCSLIHKQNRKALSLILKFKIIKL